MRAFFRRAGVLIVVVAASVTPARAEPITVGEFRWDVCKGFDPDCGLSNFVLTSLWDGPGSAPSLTSGLLTLSDGSDPLAWTSLDEQWLLPGLPEFATTTIAFEFNGALRTITETLAFADLVAFPGDPTSNFVPYTSTFGLLKFDPDAATPVPEPATLGLFASGVAMLARRISRNRKRCF
jgi:hypothetical protein